MDLENKLEQEDNLRTEKANAVSPNNEIVGQGKENVGEQEKKEAEPGDESSLKENPANPEDGSESEVDNSVVEGSACESVRTELTRSMLENVDRFLGECRQINKNGLNETYAIYETLSKIRRARKEFDATLFFVVVFGPLKAGKSTLVNALARQYVSPTKLGRECTLRPSIIIQSEETGIDEYFSLNILSDREAFDKVVDYLRGMTTEEELKKFVRKETSSLERKNIEHKLSEELPMRPVITVIRVPGGQLVNKGIALLDMPGLDGDKSNFEDSPVHNWVMSRSDFLIFIQSSIAAFNKPTITFLKEIYENSKQPPLWLVQNIIDAKHWRDLTERRSEAIAQKVGAKRKVKEVLGISDDIPATEINLGMAADGILDAQPQLVLDSKFHIFEEKLREILDLQRIRIQESNSLNGMVDTLITVQEDFSALQEVLLEKKKVYHKKLLDYDESVTLINTITYKNAYHYPRLLDQVQLMAQKRMEEWSQAVQNYAERLKGPNIDRRFKGKELNDFLYDFAAQAARLGREPYFDTNGPLGTELKKLMLETLDQSEKETFAEITTKVDEGWLDPAAGELFPFDSEYIPEIDISRFTYVPVPVKKWHLVSTKFDGGEVARVIDNNTDAFLLEIENRTSSWLATFKIKFNEYIEKRREMLRGKLQLEKETFMRNKAEEVARIDRTLALLERVEKEVVKLKISADEAARFFNDHQSEEDVFCLDQRCANQSG